MKFAVFSLLVVAIVGLCSADDQYTSKYDNVDLDQILQSERLLKNYLNCLMDRGKCTPDGAELKKNLPDALEDECSKCTPKQKEGIKKVLHYLIDNRRESWNELAAKYDPNGVYIKKYKEQAKQENINL